MSEKIRQCLIVLAFIFGLLFSIANAAADEPVAFDVPAILSGHLIELGNSITTDTIQVEVPVSLLLKDSEGLELEELLVAVYWSTNPNLVCDFQPKTILTTDVEGAIAVQQSLEKNGSVGIDSKGGYAGVVDVNGQLKFGGSNRETTSFQRRPQQDLLAASGYIKRGTGVYFKFRTSSQTTLEGTHLLSITFKVPKNWRAGLLRIDCQAKGKHSGSFDSSQVSTGSEFISAIHLVDDILAYEIAMAYVGHENRLLQMQSIQKPKKTHGNLLAHLESLVDKKQPSLPVDWYRRVVYSNSEKALLQLQGQLPRSVQEAANDFVAARKQLTGLNR